ncbi:MAG: ABC1 kinase family protein [Egibacteraceae bacterium]
MGGRLSRTARLARLSATAGGDLYAARRDERHGDREGASAHHARVADAMVEVLGSMKGAAMKVGQLLSFLDIDADDATTDVYRQRLAALRDAAPPTQPRAIGEVLASEYGAPAEQVFSAWEPQPFAVASIGQVHRARLDDGTLVAVKVQHPGVAEAVEADLANAGAFARLLRLTHPHLEVAPLLEEVRARLLPELDYQQEAIFQQAFVDRYSGHPFIRIPRVHHAWCRPRVLVTDYVQGRTFDEVAQDAQSAERDTYGEIIFRFVFGSLYRFRLFNADPHPGNFLFPGDGTVAFLDFGCTKAFSSGARARLGAVHRAVAAHDVEALRLALVEAGILRRERRDEVDVGVVLRWFDQAHEPMRENAEYTYGTTYARRVLASSSDPGHGYQEELRKLDMPADYLLLNRITFGVNSLLAQLRPTANWHAIMAELSEGRPPATPTGEAEAAFFRDSALLA